MKTIIIAFMALTVATVGLAQNKTKKEKLNVVFYGVDFSAVNVVGAGESSEKFIDAFEKINALLIAEQSKYDVAEFLDLNVISTDCNIAVKQIDKLKDAEFKDQKQTDVDINGIVSNYPNTDNQGLVIVAKELNKATNIGTFIMVIYDGSSKQVLSQQELSGKAKGFGLRNFWAGALYNGLKKAK